MPAYWKQPPKRIREDLYKKVENVDYGKKTKRWYDTPPQRSQLAVTELLNGLKNDGANLLVLQSQCDGENFRCRQCDSKWIPDELFLNKNILLQNNFNKANEAKGLRELRDMAAKMTFHLTMDTVKWVESATRSQSKSDLWHWVRIGRITASVLKNVVHTSNEFPPPKLTTLKSICHPYLQKFETPATSYGRRNEPKARKVLERLWKTDHINTEIMTCGVLLCSDNPFLAASPDAIGSCSCCGTFCVEIKCPFRLSSDSHLDSQLSIQEIAQKPNSFIKIINDEVELVQAHAYYYQMQAQIHISGADFGIFMIWSKSESITIKVPKNVDFWDHCVERSRKYFYNIIMPELLGNYYTNTHK